MEEVHWFTYLGSILCKHGRWKKNCTREESGWILRASIERKDGKFGSKKRDCDGIIILTITYGNGTRVLNESQRSMIQAVKMSHLIKACGWRRMDGDNNWSLYSKFSPLVGIARIQTPYSMKLVKRQPKGTERGVWEASPLYSIKRKGTEKERVKCRWTLNALPWLPTLNGNVSQVYRQQIWSLLWDPKEWSEGYGKPPTPLYSIKRWGTKGQGIFRGRRWCSG